MILVGLSGILEPLAMFDYISRADPSQAGLGWTGILTGAGRFGIIIY
jgi:hypothetical protein